MSLQTTDLQRLAQLTQLELGEQEIPALSQQLNNFFSFVEQIQQINTDQVEPLAHPGSYAKPASLRLREDEVSAQNQRDTYQKNAPLVHDGLYCVPQVIE